MDPEIEVRFWRRFFSESIRLFGKKSGTLEDLFIASFRQIGDECLILANHPESEAQRKKSDSGFNLDAFMRHADEVARQKFREKYPSSKIIRTYLVLIEEVTPVEEIIFESGRKQLSREDAIKEVAHRFGFPSFEACYKYLQRHGVKGLPSTWPKSKGQPEQ